MPARRTEHPSPLDMVFVLETTARVKTNEPASILDWLVSAKNDSFVVDRYLEFASLLIGLWTGGGGAAG